MHHAHTAHHFHCSWWRLRLYTHRCEDVRVLHKCFFWNPGVVHFFRNFFLMYPCTTDRTSIPDEPNTGMCALHASARCQLARTHALSLSLSLSLTHAHKIIQVQQHARHAHSRTYLRTYSRTNKQTRARTRTSR
jgi:hypothetical protein